MNRTGVRLAGRTIVVTGGTRGIGKGIALKCAFEGANVVLAGPNEQEGEAAARDVGQQTGSGAIYVRTDVRKPAECERLMAAAAERFGRIDGLVNNAGIFPRGYLLDTPEELFDDVFDVNVKGAFYCSRYAVAAMSETGGGSIVQIGSTNAYVGQPDLAAYSLSKGAALTLSKHIAAHFGSKRIRSNWITVGWVASDGEVELHEKMGIGKEELAARGASIVPSGRLQTEEDIAFGAIYLLSDESSQVTGTELAISGGHRLW